MPLVPSAILESHMLRLGRGYIDQVLIQWEGLSPTTATWEDKKAFCDNYPYFNLEDKVVEKGGGIDMGHGLTSDPKREIGPNVGSQGLPTFVVNGPILQSEPKEPRTQRAKRTS